MTAVQISSQDQPCEWKVAFGSSVPLLSVNRRGGMWQADAARRKVLRRDTLAHVTAAKWPRGLIRPRVEILVEFTSNRRRDTANLHPTVGKPIMDALGPGRSHQRRYGTRLVDVEAGGYGLVEDDSPDFLHCEDCPHLRIGLLSKAWSDRFPYGCITVTVTGLSGEVAS